MINESALLLPPYFLQSSIVSCSRSAHLSLYSSGDFWMNLGVTAIRSRFPSSLDFDFVVAAPSGHPGDLLGVTAIKASYWVWGDISLI